MERFVKIWMLLLMVSVCACSSKGGGYRSGSGGGYGGESICEEVCVEAEADMDFDNIEEINLGNTNFERKLIKEGRIHFETTDALKTREKVINIVSECKGYISKDNSTQYNTVVRYNIIARVPADKFELLLNRISESTEKLDSKDIEVLDVTEEFIDAQARLKTKKELEERYKELLKKANKVEEMLSIEKEIGILRAEIESTEGRLKYLQDRVSYSTLEVNFYEKIEKAEKSIPFGFGSKFTTALKDGWEAILSFVIGLTKLWAFLLLGVIIFFKVRYLIKRRRKKKKQNAQL